MAAPNVIKLNFETRPKDCPLVEVKEPHGRLIDADKLKGDLIKEKTRMAELLHINKDFKYIEQASGLNKARILTTIQQTIIEAEGDKKMCEWISTKDRLPEKDEVVIALIIGSDFIIQYQGETLEDAMEMARKHEWITLAFLGNDGWYEFDGFPEIVEPSYWMPLPEPPKEE